MRFDDGDMLFWHWFDRFGFDGLPDAKALHGAEGSPGRFRHQFATYAPLEHLPNPSDVLIDSFPADALVDQLLATGYECQRTKVGDQLRAIEPSDRAERGPKATNLAGLFAVLDVPLLGPCPKCQNQLIDFQ
jgi:hypothetical protein